MRTLLLNQGYSPDRFLNWKHAVKLVVLGKVDVVSNWNSEITFGRGSMPHPAIIRLKHYTPYHVKMRRYKRSGIMKRDRNTCQYCGLVFPLQDLTIDHVKPRAQGGETNWGNCVAACYGCNNKKADRTPRQAGMKLLNGKRKGNKSNIWHEYELMSNKHDDWEIYIR